MALPLSQDLRARIGRAVEEGVSIRQAAARFAVSPSAAIKLDGSKNLAMSAVC